MNTRKSGSRKYGGFPRSGNHLLQIALEKAFPNDRPYWCEHRIAPIHAPGYFWTIIRHPIDAVRSWHYFFPRGSQPDYKSSLAWYTQHQEALHNNRDRIIAISFEEAIQDIGSIIRKGAEIEASTPESFTNSQIVEELKHRFPRNHPDHSPTKRSTDVAPYVEQEHIEDAVAAYNKSLDLFDLR